MNFDKPCNFCPEEAAVWLRLDGGRGEALFLCTRHHGEILAMLIDLQQLACPECGTEIHLEESAPEVPANDAVIDERQAQFDL